MGNLRTVYLRTFFFCIFILIFVGEINSDDDDDEDDNRRRKKNKPVGFLDQDDGPKPIEQALLKKYLAYSRTMCKPVLQAVDSEKVTKKADIKIIIQCDIYHNFYSTLSPKILYTLLQISSLYAELRRQSSISGGVPIAVRHIGRY